MALWAAAILPLLLSLACVAGKDWSPEPQAWKKDWKDCNDPEFQKDQKGPFDDDISQQRLAMARRLADHHEEYHKIIDFDAGGFLEIKDETVFHQLQDSEENINLIVIYGQNRVGKSTFASMLSCAMTHGEDGMFFPAKHDEDASVTKGLWASEPFTFDGKKYMIMDMQGLGDFRKSKTQEDALTKMLAMLSEVASVFVYMLNDHSVRDIDWQNVGHALKATREHLITRFDPEEFKRIQERRGDKGQKEMAKEHWKSHNHPALVFVTRNPTKSIVDDNLILLEKKYDEKAAGMWNHIRGEGVLSEDERAQGSQVKHDDFAELMVANFQNHSLGDTSAPFRVWPLPIMGRHVGKIAEYAWDTNDPFTMESHKTCGVYKHMGGPHVQCKIKEAGGSMPSPPAVFRMMMDTLAHKIHDAAPSRSLSASEAQAVSLTGKTLFEFINYGVAEMNAIGPLPETELWRKIMEDACTKLIKEKMWTYLGTEKEEKDGEVIRVGVLKTIDDDIQEAVNKVEKCRQAKDVKGCEDISSLPPRILKSWDEREKLWGTARENFLGRPTYNAVREVCTADASREELHLESKKKHKYQQSMAVWNEMRNQIQAKEIAELKDKLDAAEFAAWWERNKLFVMVGGIIGIVICIYVCKFTGQVHRCLSIACAPLRICCGVCMGMLGAKAVHAAARPHAPSGLEMQDRAAMHPPTAAAQPPLAPAAPAPPGPAHYELPTETQKRLENLEVLMLKMKASEAGESSAGPAPAATK